MAKNKLTPNAKQKKWLNDITQWVNDNGLHCLYGDEYFEDTRMQRHHVVGRSARQNKVDIGHWFVIPVPYELHEPNLNHEFHVGHRKKAFVKQFGTQRGIFQVMISAMEHDGYEVPTMEVYKAIMDTNA